MSKSVEIRRLLNLLEDVASSQPSTALPPRLVKYMDRFPETIADSPEALIAEMKNRAKEGSRFTWTIAKLPDGRYIELSNSFAKECGLPIVQQGTSFDLQE